MADIKMSSLYDELLIEVARINVGDLEVARRKANIDLDRSRAMLAARQRRQGHSGLFGEVLYVRGGFIHGWILDSEDLHRKIVVEATVDGRVVARSTANETVPMALRTSLPKNIDANVGFVLRAFSSAKNMSRKLVDVSAVGDSYKLASDLSIFPPRAKLKGTSFEGFSDSSNDGVARGWAWNAEEPEARFGIIVFIDGFPVARGQASRFRSDLTHAHVGTGDHAFAIPIARELMVDRERAIEFVIAENGLRLPGCPMVIRGRHIFPAPLPPWAQVGQQISKATQRLTTARRGSSPAK